MATGPSLSGTDEMMTEWLNRFFKGENIHNTRLLEKMADLNESETQELMKSVGNSVRSSQQGSARRRRLKG